MHECLSHHSRWHGGVVRLLLPVALAFSISDFVGAQPAAGAGQSATPTVPSSRTEAKADPVENSVLKVFTTARYPDLYQPWTKQAPNEFTGSSFPFWSVSDHTGQFPFAEGTQNGVM